MKEKKINREKNEIKYILHILMERVYIVEKWKKINFNYALNMLVFIVCLVW